MSPAPENAVAIWRDGLAKFKSEHSDLVHHLAHVSDLAEREFFRRSAGKEGHPLFADEAPAFVQLVILRWVLDWMKGRSPPIDRRKGPRRKWT